VRPCVWQRVLIVLVLEFGPGDWRSVDFLDRGELLISKEDCRTYPKGTKPDNAFRDGASLAAVHKIDSTPTNPSEDEYENEA
jgi:hypothetical protein